MKFTTAISSVALLVAAVNAQTTPDPAINTPTSLTTCQPILLTFSGTHPPFIISVVPGGQPGAQPIETIGTDITGTSFTWKVDVAAGTYVGFHIVDSIGASQDSAALTIIAGSDISCIGKNSLTSSGAASSTSAAASSSSTSAAASTTASGVSSSASVSSVSSSSGVSVTSAASSSSTASVSRSVSSSASVSASSTSSSNAAVPTQASQWAVIALGVVGGAAALV